MKKLLLLALLAIMMVGCSKTEDIRYKVYYNIYYPNNVKSYTVIVSSVPHLYSDRGTNYLLIRGFGGYTIAATSAPIEVTKIEAIVKKNNTIKQEQITNQK